MKDFYLVIDGIADIVIGIPDRAKKHNFSGQLTRDIDNFNITISTVQQGQFFG